MRPYPKQRNNKSASFQSNGTILPFGSFSSFGKHGLDEVSANRRSPIKAAMIHAWDAYVSVARGPGELNPVSRKGTDSLAKGLGTTIMGLNSFSNNDTERRASWERLAKALTDTCYNMYQRSPSGLSGEYIRLSDDDKWRMDGGYHLRPEAVEAKSHRPRKQDLMHSFLIAETFKYLYLAFGKDEELALDKWVFNTEAHPLLITPALGESSKTVLGVNNTHAPTMLTESEELSLAQGEFDCNEKNNKFLLAP